MLYFKTKTGRLVIEILIDSSKNECLYMLIPSPKELQKSYYVTHSFIQERIWHSFCKKAEPTVLQENDVDYQTYCQSVDDDQIFQEEMANLDWQMSMAYHYR